MESDQIFRKRKERFIDGEVVVRSMEGDHSFQHTAMRFLESKGFENVPRFLGIDHVGRECLSLIPGHVPETSELFNDVQLTAAGKLLRKFHDVTADMPEVVTAKAEVLCHNDWGPHNAVFRENLPVGMIDFDTIAVGSRLWDLGFSAMSWLRLADPNCDGAEQIRRIKVFVWAYGIDCCSVERVLVYAVARLTLLASWMKQSRQFEDAAREMGAANWISLNMIEPLLLSGHPF